MMSNWLRNAYILHPRCPKNKQLLPLALVLFYFSETKSIVGIYHKKSKARNSMASTNGVCYLCWSPPKYISSPNCLTPPLFPDDTGQTKITSKILGLNANEVVEKLAYNAIRLKKRLCLELDYSEVRYCGVKRCMNVTEVVIKSCGWPEIYPFVN